MSATLAVTWLVHWVGFIALAAMIGGLVVDLLVLPADALAVLAARRRLRALGVGAAVVLLLSAGGELWLRAGTMSGGGPELALRAVPTVLRHTHFGSVWIARAAALLVLLPLLISRSAGLRRLAALVALGVVLSMSLTGHAGDWGDVSLPVGIDWAHAVAATAWTGGLLTLLVVVLPSATRWPSPLVVALIRRFSRLAAWCLALVALSGVYNAWLQLATASALWQTGYGRVLGAKVLVVLALAFFGAANRYTVLPGLGAERAAGAVPSRLVTYVAAETGLAIVVFACTAVLVDSTPGRHARHLEHHGAHEAARPPMAELGRLSR